MSKVIGLDIDKLETKKFDNVVGMTNLKKYVGKDVKIIRELFIGEEIDKCVAPMFLVDVCGDIIHAYADEVLTDECMKSIFTEEFIKEYR